MSTCPVAARQRLGSHAPAAKNTRYNRRIAGHVRIVSKESRLSVLGKTSCICLFAYDLFNDSGYTTWNGKQLIENDIEGRDRAIRRSTIPPITFGVVHEGENS
jgi:hypothetical protein